MAGLLSPASALEPAGDPVTATLQRWAAEPFAWGTSDCAQAVFDYIELATGRPIADRPRYASQRGAMLFAGRHGGFVAACHKLLPRMGLERMELARRGRIGLIDLPGSGPTLCLCCLTEGQPRAQWAARSDQGLVVFTGLPALAVWRVACRRP